MRIQRLILSLAAVASLFSCKESRKPLLPNVSGKAGEVLVVIERENWEGDLGVAIRETLAAETPYLAQREPLFNLSNVPPGSFNNMFKLHRNLFLVNINPQLDSASTLFSNNRWAAPQSIVQLSAPTEAAALEVFSKEKHLVAEYYEQAERDRIIANSKLYEELKLQDPFSKVTGGIIHFPSGYRLRKSTEDFVWIADEKQYTIQAVMAYRFPVGKEPFSLENLLEQRNAAMKANVPGMFDGSYMTTSTAVEPVLKSLSFHGRAFMEMRGFWEVHGDYMGGPFVSHAFYGPDGKEIIVCEAFVYAPRYDKRQYLRQVESLLYSFEWQKDKK